MNSIHDLPCTCDKMAANFSPPWKATPEEPHHCDCPQASHIGNKCPTCGWTIQADVCDGGDFVITGCSDFCERMSPEVMAAYRAGLKEGEWGIWPCSECGQPVEDEYTPDGWCANCHHPRGYKLRGQLLVRVLHEAWSTLPGGLVEEICKELDLPIATAWGEQRQAFLAEIEKRMEKL